MFGCVAPDLEALSEPDRQHCAARLGEVFNRTVSAGRLPESGALRVDVPDCVSLGPFRRELDRLASGGQPLDVYVGGRSLCSDFDDRAIAERVAAFYTLCFAHPAVRAIIWIGFWDGEAGTNGNGLLRLNFSPRPAFRFLHKLIGTIWHSRAAGETDPKGRFCFRGFFGDYRVAARIAEDAVTVMFPFRAGALDPTYVFAIP